MRYMMVLMLLLAGVAEAKSPIPVPVRQPNPPLMLTPANLDEHGAEVQTVMVEVLMGKGMENPQWLLTPVAIQVLLAKLQEESPLVPMKPALLALAKEPEPDYRGIKVSMKLLDGTSFQTLTLHKGRITSGGTLVKQDVGRGLEYWLFSTARVKRDLNLGPKVVPVWTFEQCRLLGMPVVETEPRQCLLPENGIVLQRDEQPDKASLKVQGFDDCLKHGEALIGTFPRRCVVAGGRVFTEPPRVPETEPADAPLAAGAETRMDSPTVGGAGVVTPTVVNNPLLGQYAISVTEVSASAAVVSGTLEISETIDVSATMGVLLDLSPSDVVSGSVVEDAPVPDVAPAAGPIDDEPGVMPWFERLNRWWGLK